MPLPKPCLVFIHSQGLDRHGPKLAASFPALWEKEILPVTGPRPRKPPFTSGIDEEKVKSAWGGTKPRFAVLVVIDEKPERIREATDTLIYKYPTLDVVGVRSGGNVADAMQSVLKLYGLIPSDQPADLEQALDIVAENTKVRVESMARKSATVAAAFREPNLALLSMHSLRLVRVNWYEAKQRNPRAAKNAQLTRPDKYVLRELIPDSRFDVSDAADKAKPNRMWMCDDEEKRYFGLHLKWNLEGEFNLQNFCRIHYASDWDKGIKEARLYIGHCGEHLE